MIETVRHTLLRQALEGSVKIVGLTVDQYHELIENGTLAQDTRTELIDGLLVQKDRAHKGEDPKTVGMAHAWVITQLTKLGGVIASHGALLRMQLPIIIPPDDEPEPDAVIVRGDRDDYSAGHPNASDVYCLIEVADSSLESDRVAKKRVYADAGVPFYFIINLVERVVESYSQPMVGQGSYATAERFFPGQSIRLSTGPSTGIEVKVDQLLPKRQ